MTDIPVTKRVNIDWPRIDALELAVANIEEQAVTQQYEYRTIGWDLMELKDAFLRHVHEEKVKTCLK